MKIFLQKQLIILQEKTTANTRHEEKLGHYANECKNRKHNKLIETLDSLDYIELGEEEALDLTLNNTKGIVEIILDNKYEKSDYKETSYIMKSSSVSLSDL